MAWLPRPYRPLIAEDEPEVLRRRVFFPPALINSLFKASARGLYRVFNPAVYRFWWTTGTPPVAGTTPTATNLTLAFAPSGTFADGTYFLSVSLFDGVLDSGFLPLGPGGENYLTMVISGGALLPTPPSAPTNASLIVLGGGVIQIVAYYYSDADGVNAATEWAIAYTTDGTTPPNGSPTVTQAMPIGGSDLQVLVFNLPAQTAGTVVKVQLQTARLIAGPSYVYSTPGTVLSATAVTAGPSAPLGVQSWPGNPPEGVQ